jgi:predicted ATPase
VGSDAEIGSTRHHATSLPEILPEPEREPGVLLTSMSTLRKMSADSWTIRTPDQRLRVFVSSTMNELAPERVAARRAIERVRLIPVLFELGARPYPPRDLYLAYMRQSHVFVGIYGQQYGWIAPGRQISGLEDEYLAAADMPKLIYVQPSTPQRDPRLTSMLERMGQGGLSYRVFRGTRELAMLLADDLAVLLSERFDQPRQVASEEIEVRPPPRPAANRFVGRRALMERLTALLTDDAVRLVTVVGPGGIGKTRLALELSAALAKRFDEVVVAELENVTSPGAVPTALAAVLGLPDSATSTPIERAARLLAARRILLVVDNFEQVIAAAPDVSRLAAAAGPGSALLVTSRERLRLSSERVVEVGPLSLPASDGTGDAAEASEALELFVDRMTEMGGRRELGEGERRTAAEICRRLDGLPLALELAAARARTLGVDEVLRRLGDGLGILSGGARDLPDRQQTLRSAIAWSADLLPGPEHAIFARLSVFAGSFSLDAVEAICGDDSGADVLDGLASLVDKSLLRAMDPVHGRARFVMLQLIRQYAAEQLDPVERAELQRRHADYYEAVSGTLTTAIRNGGREVLTVHAADEENLRAAMSWALGEHDPGRVVRMASALWPFWWIRSSFADAIDLLRRAQEQQGMTRHEQLLADLVLGLMAFGHGDEGLAVSCLEKVVSSSEAQPRELATARIPLGLVLAVQGDDAAIDHLRSAAEEFRALDDQWGLAFALMSLGGGLVLLNRHEEALHALHESVALADALDADVFLSNALTNLGWACLGTGRTAEARAPLLRSLSRALETNNADSLARGLDAIAALALAVGKPREGAMLLGAADATRTSVGSGIWPTDRVSNSGTTTGIRSALSPESYAVARSDGAKLRGPEIVELAAEV